MRLILITVLTVATMLAYAEDDYEGAVRRLIKAKTAGGAFENMVEKYIDNAKGETAIILKKHRDEIVGFWMEIMTEDRLIAAYSRICREHLSKDDILSIAAFYETEAGKRFAFFHVELEQGVARELQQFMPEFQERIGKIINTVRIEEAPVDE
jgi:uncharacterized protein